MFPPIRTEHPLKQMLNYCSFGSIDQSLRHCAKQCDSSEGVAPFISSREYQEVYSGILLYFKLSLCFSINSYFYRPILLGLKWFLRLFS